MKARYKIIVGLAIGILAGTMYVRARKEQQQQLEQPIREDSEYVDHYFV